MAKGKIRALFAKKGSYLIFVGSLVLILLVPIITFTLLFTNFFQKSYTQKLFSLADAACSRTQVYFEQTVHQCDRIADMLEVMPLFQAEDPGSTPECWRRIISQLDDARVLNEALVDVVYQRDDSGVLFTSSSPIYAPIGVRDPAYRLPEIPEQPGFYQPAFLGSGPSSTSAVLAYTVSLSDGRGALTFWLNAEQLLPAPVDGDHRFSLMLQDNGVTIWQQGTVQNEDFSGDPVSSSNGYDLYKTSTGRYYLKVMQPEGCTARISFILPYGLVMGESDTMTRVFILGVVIEAALCIALIVFLTQRSYRPVHELYGSVLKFAPELLPPVGTGEIEAASYALRELSDRRRDLEQQRQSDFSQRVLHRLFAGSLKDFSTLDKLGIRKDGCYTVVFFSLRREFPDEVFSPLQAILQELLKQRERVFYSTEYIESRSCLYLLELSPGEEPEKLLMPVAQVLEHRLGRAFYFGCGSPVDQVDQVWRSYCEALAAPGGMEEDRLVYSCDCIRGEDSFASLYPQAELDGLYNAIVSGNVERVHFLFDSLMKRIEQSRGRFLAFSLAYAAAVTLLQGAEALGVSSGQFERPPFRDYEDARGYLLELSRQVMSEQVRRNTRESGDARSESDGFEQILVYIRDNIDNPDLSVSLIGDAMNISPSTLGKLFHDRTGTTISDYMGSMRHEHIKMLLLSTDLPVSEIARRMGYSQTSSFIRRFKSIEGITPGEFRQKQREQGSALR